MVFPQSFGPAYTGYPANSLLRFRNYGITNYAPYFVSGSNVYLSTGSSIGMSYPSIVESGDYIVIIVSLAGSYSVTVPTGFSTLFNLSNYSSNYGSSAVFYKVANGTEDGAAISAVVNTSSSSAIVVQYRNATSISGNSLNAFDSNALSGNTPAVTTNKLGVVSIFTKNYNIQSTHTFTVPTGTVRAAVSDDDYDFDLGGVTFSLCDASVSASTYSWANGILPATYIYFWRASFTLSN